MPVGATKASDEPSRHFIRWPVVTDSQYFHQYLQQFDASRREINDVIGRIAETRTGERDTSLRNIAGCHPHGSARDGEVCGQWYGNDWYADGITGLLPTLSAGLRIFWRN